MLAGLETSLMLGYSQQPLTVQPCVFLFHLGALGDEKAKAAQMEPSEQRHGEKHTVLVVDGNWAKID